MTTKGEWLPIATAPKGRTLLLWVMDPPAMGTNGGCFTTGGFDTSRQEFGDYIDGIWCKASHWMPKPEAPQAADAVARGSTS